MADPLKLLREFSLKNKTIAEKDGYIVFGDIAYPRDVKTNFKVYGKQNEYYTLESLHYFYQKKGMAHTAYVKEAAGKQLQPVTRPDRKDLIEYLTSESAKPPASIDLTAPLPVPVQYTIPDHHRDAPVSKRSKLEHTAQMQKEKERIERILDAPLRPPPTKDALRDLSKDLTADKIRELKTKMITKKRTQIKSTEEDLNLGFGGAGEEVEEREMDSDLLDRELRLRERLWETRTTCMETGSKNFAKSVFPLLQSLKSREDGKPGDSQTAAPKQTDAPKSKTQQQPGYSRYDQERFRKEETEGFQIDTMGTYHGITLKSITEGVKPKHQTPKETPASASAQAANNRPQKRVSRTPIIVIPATNNSLITMYNARDLLQEHIFISTEDKKGKGFRRDNEVLIHRQKEGGVTVPFRVIDNPLKLTVEEWDRVVAVFVQGPAWQFKGWPWGGNPVDIFSKVAAFHLKWDEMNLDGNVSKWNVNILTLSKTKRHLDRASLLRFWEILDRYMAKNKSHLRF